MDTPTPTATVSIDGQALDGSASALLPLVIGCDVGMDGVGRCSVDVIVPGGAKLPAPGAPLTIATEINNTDRSAGAMLSGKAVRL